MTKVRVYVSYKASILDPQAQAIKAATHKMGYSIVESLNVGKYFDFELDSEANMAEEKVAEIANELLANPNMETYKVEVLN
ncbi:phosphoribosylformylglycinamidine synthase subunit PurS [Lactovum miscens]|uniref:Phosphoribosylformylglycinamidine synthase subunit PurS n=1 Tax=Lactovum miscens TaxID=190387 RepID=A0A841C6Y7_9LACT|nr:phosphoribosylformylglycinamidine synthase subunit PurS [Lactovum miscens]MBB5887159.1 phosphoribosylformylglycinamidine synthase [Lactovum miscens]